MGDAGLMHLPGTGEIELGYRISPAWWNRGLATEAGEAWRRHGLQALGIPRLIAFAHPDNAASLRVLEKLDFAFQRMDEMGGMHARVYSIRNPRRHRPPTPAVLETSRLYLREMGMGDLEFMASLLAHPGVMRYYPACCSREESENWVRRQQHRYARDGFGFWLAIEKATGSPIGQAGVLLHEVEGKSEIGLGYMLDRPFWARGFATEAAAASRDYVFDTLGRSRLLCLVRPENEPSRAVAQRLGMAVNGCTKYAGFTHLVFTLSRGAHQRQPSLPPGSSP
jgi:RimJ/RimL family protein N-acetyltransferase